MTAHETGRAAGGARPAVSRAGKPAARRIMPPRLMMLAVVAMAVLHFVFPGAQLVEMPLTLLGGLPIFAGLVLNLWADDLFKKYTTPVDPFAAPAFLMTTGPFTFTRNPMYLGMVMALIGFGGLLGSLTPLVVPALFAFHIQRHYILVEEAHMEDTFGGAFDAYRRKVRRWI